MVAPQQSNSGLDHATESPIEDGTDLPFRVEIGADSGKVERVVARAHSAALAHAIFSAACQEYPNAHLTLWHGQERVAEKKA
jgi:hypothetical protein